MGLLIGYFNRKLVAYIVAVTSRWDFAYAQACEEIFAWMSCMAPQVRYINQSHMLFYLMCMADEHNKLLEKRLPPAPAEPLQWMSFSEIWSGTPSQNKLYNERVVRTW
jgi:hypothetical protein